MKKIVAVFVLFISLANLILTAIVMDWIFGYAAAAPEWAKLLSTFYLVLPMAFAFVLVTVSFQNK